jgi:hypothetical protein
MNRIICTGGRRSPMATRGLSALLAALLSMTGCHKNTLGPDAPGSEAKNTGISATAPDHEAPAGEGVSLKPAEIEKMGIATEQVKASTHTPEVTGFGVVMSHDAIAQAVAELITAVAVERQSHAAFARGLRLAGTPGAMPADTQEAAERQATVDQASLELVKRRLSSIFGQSPPWKEQQGGAQLSSLASGKSKLVRVTFPLGAFAASNPATVRFAHLGAARDAKGWESRSVWSAPADPTVPGRSFFALLTSSDIGEGERLLAWGPVGGIDSGVLVPSSAAVISGGKYWCYLEKKPGLFVRTEIDTSMPSNDGYFVKNGVAVGDKVVTTSAGELLARETNPSADAD